MEIAPLIHSRTFYCDFSQNFAVRPNDLNVQWAMNKILPAMRDVDILNGVRCMFATDGKLCIAGVACNFRYFVDNYLSADERTEAANYLHDERGREVKIFLGYAFKGSGVPDVSDSKLWQMFKQTLAPKWNNQTVETVIAPSPRLTALRFMKPTGAAINHFSSNALPNGKIFAPTSTQLKSRRAVSLTLSPPRAL